MPDLADLLLIENEFLAKHKEYRKIISSTPFAQSDGPDANTLACIIAEGAFTRYFTLWENSIEKVFIYYCEGGSSLRGFKPICKLFNCNATEIRKILTNGFRYLDWSSQKSIRERANLFFENGEPFYSPVVGKSHVLTDIEKLRNMIAHNSIESASAYRDVQRNNFQTERNFEMTPGQMLRIRKRQSSTNWGEFYFDEVEAVFTAVTRT